MGATIAAVVNCITAFVQSTAVGIAALIFYLCYQQFENYAVQTTRLPQGGQHPEVAQRRLDAS